jgi:hypothetical protein
VILLTSNLGLTTPISAPDGEEKIMLYPSGFMKNGGEMWKGGTGGESGQTVDNINILIFGADWSRIGLPTNWCGDKSEEMEFELINWC